MSHDQQRESISVRFRGTKLALGGRPCAHARVCHGFLLGGKAPSVEPQLLQSTDDSPPVSDKAVGAVEFNKKDNHQYPLSGSLLAISTTSTLCAIDDEPLQTIREVVATQRVDFWNWLDCGNHEFATITKYL